MYKIKSKSAAKKRFYIYSSKGLFKRKKAFKNHILTKKNTKRKRKLRKKTIINKNDIKSIKVMLPLYKYL